MLNRKRCRLVKHHLSHSRGLSTDRDRGKFYHVLTSSPNSQLIGAYSTTLPTVLTTTTVYIAMLTVVVTAVGASPRSSRARHADKQLRFYFCFVTHFTNCLFVLYYHHYLLFRLFIVILRYRVFLLCGLF